LVSHDRRKISFELPEQSPMQFDGTGVFVVGSGRAAWSCMLMGNDLCAKSKKFLADLGRSVGSVKFAKIQKIDFFNF
jgi:hypothetical protein